MYHELYFFIRYQFQSLFQVNLLFPALGLFIPTSTLLYVLHVSHGNLFFLLFLFTTLLKVVYCSIAKTPQITQLKNGQRGYVKGQPVHEKVLNITCHQGNAN